MLRGALMIPGEFRSWLVSLIAHLAITQKELAEQCGVTQPWISQLLTAKRKRCDKDLMSNLKQGLLNIVNCRNDLNLEELRSQLELNFSPFVQSETFTTEMTGEALRVAAQAFDLIAKECPSRLMRRQVVEFLKIAIESQC